MTFLSRIQLDCQSCAYVHLKNMGLTLGAAIRHMPMRMSKLKCLKAPLVKLQS
jgi:antitoxin component of RelBE/YafQ-DinJ toxin-antitoxin module